MSEIEYNVAKQVQIVGLWAYEVTGDVQLDGSEAFPPFDRLGAENIRLIAMLPGHYKSIEDCPLNWLRQVVKDGLTHIMLPQGTDGCFVYSLEEVQGYLKDWEGYSRMSTNIEGYIRSIEAGGSHGITREDGTLATKEEALEYLRGLLASGRKTI